MLNELKQIRSSVEDGTWQYPSEGNWAGAQLYITDNPLEIKDPDPIRKDHIVYTGYAAEVSALICDISDTAKDFIAGIDNFEFYYRLGKKVEIYSKDHNDLKGLLLAVIDEATLIYKLNTGRRYLAYGSNMYEEQMFSRCPDAVMLEKYKVFGYRLALDSKGYATIIEDKDSFIWSLIWLVLPQDEAALDKFEGVRSNSYRKETIKLPAPGSESMSDVFVYISNRDPDTGNRQPGYLDKLIMGAQEHDFPEDYVDMIRSLDRFTEADNIFLFTYGTLMKDRRAHSLMASSEYIGQGRIRGFAIYDLGAYPGIRPCPGGIVTGELYRVDSGEDFQKIRQYEGDGELYVQTRTPVELDSGETVTAVTFVWNAGYETGADDDGLLPLDGSKLWTTK